MSDIKSENEAALKMLGALLTETGQLKFIDGVPFVDLTYLDAVRREATKLQTSFEESFDLVNAAAASAYLESIGEKDFLNILKEAFGSLTDAAPQKD